MEKDYIERMNPLTTMFFSNTKTTKRTIPIEVPLVLRILEYGTRGDHPNFSKRDLRKDLKLNSSDSKMINQYVATNVDTARPNHIMVYSESLKEQLNKEKDDYLCVLLPNAIMMYNEFEEIRLARENAEGAKIQSQKAHDLALLAFWVSLTVGVVQIVISIITIKK